MSNIFSNNYLVNRPIERAVQKFAGLFTPTQSVLDIGCGTMPYRPYFSCRYVGADPEPAVKPDLICPAWRIPMPDHSFDGIISNQALEHIARPFSTVTEIHRLLKPGGMILLTTPQTMKNHSRAIPSSSAPYHNFDRQLHPYWQNDYYRFTKYGLIYLFRQFTILDLRETTGYFGSICQLFNYFFASTNQHHLFTPVYLLNNLAGLTGDLIARSIIKLGWPTTAKFHYFIFSSLTINLIMIAQKHD